MYNNCKRVLKHFRNRTLIQSKQKKTLDGGIFHSSRYYYTVDIEVFIDCQAIFPKFIYA